MPVPCFHTDRREDVVIISLRANLFDEMPDEFYGPIREADVRREFAGVSLDSTSGVILDLRAAGNVSHRTLSLLFQLAYQLSARVGQVAVCGSTEFAEIWRILRTPYAVYTDLPKAVASLQTQHAAEPSPPREPAVGADSNGE